MIDKILLLLIVTVASGCAGISTPSSNEIPPIVSEFFDNPETAKDRYLKKRITVWGNVSEVIELPDSGFNVSIGGNIESESEALTYTVVCTFDGSNKSAKAKIKKGEQHKLSGNLSSSYSYGGLLVMLKLENCQIEK